MPTGDPHIGHKLVFDEIIWHQQQGGDAYALIADLEAHSARGLSWDEIDETRRTTCCPARAGFDPDEGTLTVSPTAARYRLSVRTRRRGKLLGVAGDLRLR